MLVPFFVKHYYDFIYMHVMYTFNSEAAFEANLEFDFKIHMESESFINMKIMVYLTPNS